MFKNYLKIALRTIVKNKVSSFINIVGLALGIASCILIFLYVRNELSYDKQFSGSERIYRVNAKLNLPGQDNWVARSSYLMGPGLKEDYSEIEQMTHLFAVGKQAVWYDDKVFNEENIYFADSDFFKVFDYKLSKGDISTALLEPRGIVISEEMAGKYFGSSDPMGKIVKFTRNNYTVRGVLKNEGLNNHLNPNALLSFSTLDTAMVNAMKQDWFRLAFLTYVKFKQKINPQEYQAKMDRFVDIHLADFMKRFQLSGKIKIQLQPLEDIHLTPNILYDVPGNSNKSYIYIFSIVAIFVLLIACINYMNMATARAGKRAREVGVRKVLGALRKQLLWQFLGESILISLFALVLALVLVEFMLPYFNSLTDINFKSQFLASLQFLPFLVGIVLIVGIIGGSYPAFFLSSFRPVDVLKSQKTPKGGSSLLRKSLVVTQFSISTVLVVGTIIVWSQMDFMKKQDLGFNKEQVVAMRIAGGDSSQVRRVNIAKEAFFQNHNVEKVATGDGIPGEETGRLIFFTQQNGKKTETPLPFMFIDYDYLDLLGIKLTQGRNFSRDYKTDAMTAFIVNEAAVKEMQWKEPIGQEMENGLGLRGKVIGVVKDYHFASLHNKIEPMVLMLQPRPRGYILSKIKTSDISNTVAFLEKTWKKIDPKHPVEYFFLDQNFDLQYRKEEKMLTIFGYFSAITIIIACMGLFGLAAFTSEQRTKEVGIRKVNGASLKDIAFLFVKDFMKLVGISLLVAFPLAWYLMHTWLQDFAYRISLGPGPFIFAGVMALGISLLTVSYHALRTANMNPVKALRYE